MKKTLNPLIDPRGQQERPILKLAPRPTLAQLKKGKILFYNNTKLDFCNYGETFARIKERFREMGITNFVDYKETVRGKGSKVLEDYAAMLAKEKPIAAVLALGDMGTSPPRASSPSPSRAGIPSATSPPLQGASSSKAWPCTGQATSACARSTSTRQARQRR